MKIFIFGAGASKGSYIRNIPDEFSPPLVDELFDDRYQKYADQMYLYLPDLEVYKEKIKGVQSLEKWLTSEWERIKELKQENSKVALKGQLAQIAFFIWLTLLKVSEFTYQNGAEGRAKNAYRFLMQKLLANDAPFGLISFNYDLLLDFAYKDVFKINLSSLGSYLNNNYVKPHGSVNWFLPKRTQDPLIDLTKEYNMDTRVRLHTAINRMYVDIPIPIDGIQIKDPDHRDLYIIDDLLRTFDSQYFYPLIFLPLTVKAYSFISGFEEKILLKAKELLSNAEEIYLIGYRANDDIIRELLKKTPAETQLYVVGLQSAEQIMKEVLSWATHLKRGKVYEEGFLRFVEAYE